MATNILILDCLVGCISRVEDAKEQDDETGYDDGDHCVLIHEVLSACENKKVSTTASVFQKTASAIFEHSAE